MKKKLQLILTCVIIVLLAIFINVRIISPFSISGMSMYPTLEPNALVFVLKTSDICENDIVLLRQSDGTYIVKRVIGTSGDCIELYYDRLYVNKILIDTTVNSTDERYYALINVPNESIFVLGDNRLESYDSRDFGCMPLDAVVGVLIH